MKETREYSNDWMGNLGGDTPQIGVAGSRRNGLKNLRRVVLATGFALLAMSGFLLWRAANPALSEREIVAAQLEEMRFGIEKRQAGSVTRYLATDFSWNGMDTKTLRASVPQALMQWRDVKLSFSKQQVAVRGSEATTAGRYSLSVRETPEAKTETFQGDYSLLWQKRDGRWNIIRATGGDNLPGVGAGNAADAAF
jgi:HAMP domain-containing protein